MARNVFGIGETVLDIIFKNDEPVAAKPGGSTFNALISLGRLNIPSSFISDLGDDKVGDIIVKFLTKNKVDHGNVNRLKEIKSAISLAFLDDKNDANYTFYKDYSKQNPTTILPNFKPNDILLFGSFYAINPKIRGVVKDILNHAKKNKVIIYYDPNFRSSHLHELDEVKAMLVENFNTASIIRGSNEDFENIFGEKEAEHISKHIQNKIAPLIVTKNSEGVDVFYKHQLNQFPSQNLTPVSTIGAGDNFNAGFIYALIKQNILFDDLSNINTNQWKKLIETAVAFSSDVCTSYDNYISESFAEQIRS